ncbi:NOP58 family protein [Candidatus Micrarchaeota archaeon]|nr:NOP58 family protein [Candidatus Micrarchaeota archaeon]
MISMNRLNELRNKFLEQTKKQVSQEYGEQEIGIIRATNALEDLDASSNLLFEHTREWYHSFFPELERILNDPDLFLQLVYEIGHKKDFSPANLDKLVKNSDLKEKIIQASQKSIGATEEKNLGEIRVLALNALNLKQERTVLEKFINTELNALAPNFSTVAGSLLGAKLLSKAGSLKRLAEMPASTIQLLGAEKALFRYLKTKRKTPPPKHGFLYGHSLVKQLPPSHKGAMARTLAGKLSLAIKADVFGKTNITEELDKKLKVRFELLQKKPVKPKKTRLFPFQKYPVKKFQKRKPFSFNRRPIKRFQKKKPFFRKKTGQKNKY